METSLSHEREKKNKKKGKKTKEKKTNAWVFAKSYTSHFLSFFFI